jgi:hypothetical protein
LAEGIFKMIYLAIYLLSVFFVAAFTVREEMTEGTVFCMLTPIVNTITLVVILGRKLGQEYL